MAIDLREQALINKYFIDEADRDENGSDLIISSAKIVNMKQNEIDTEFENLDLSEF